VAKAIHKKKSSFVVEDTDDFDSSLYSGDDTNFKIDESPIHTKLAYTK
jgi:hypothetical protein